MRLDAELAAAGFSENKAEPPSRRKEISFSNISHSLFSLQPEKSDCPIQWVKVFSFPQSATNRKQIARIEFHDRFMLIEKILHKYKPLRGSLITSDQFYFGFEINGDIKSFRLKKNEFQTEPVGVQKLDR